MSNEIEQYGRSDPGDMLRHAFRNVDEQDWRHLPREIPDSGHGKFWKAVFAEVRQTLAATAPVETDTEALEDRMSSALGLLKAAEAVMAPNLYPKPEAGPEEPWGVLTRIRNFLKATGGAQ